jgi:hypothetical protein
MCECRRMGSCRWRFWVYIWLERHLVCVCGRANCCGFYYGFPYFLWPDTRKLFYNEPRPLPYHSWCVIHIYPCVSNSLLYDLRSCYADSIIIFELPLLSSMRAVSLQVNVSLTYCWYLVQVQKHYTCCVHSVLMHCNSNVGTQYHGTIFGAPEGPPCHTCGNVHRNRVSWKSGLLWLMINRAFLLVLSLLAWP